MKKLFKYNPNVMHEFVTILALAGLALAAVGIIVIY